MKTKNTELNVDFIGEQGGLTIQEEKALHIFFKERKIASISAKTKQRQRLTKREQAFA